MPIKINGYDGKEYLMSDEVYIQIVEHHYPKGTLLRLINGVDDKDKIGYHFSEGFVTVNSVMEPMAGWIGIKREHIRKVGTLVHLPIILEDI